MHVDKQILNANETICENIEECKNNKDKRWLYSWNIANVLRNFVEWIIVKVSWIKEYHYDILKEARKI